MGQQFEVTNNLRRFELGLTQEQHKLVVRAGLEVTQELWTASLPKGIFLLFFH